eukprot:3362924-Pleurochrysis_carterae.AAC.1
MRRGHPTSHRKGRSGGHQTQGRAGARQRITHQSYQPRALSKNGGTCRTQLGGNDGKVDAVPTRRTRGPASQRGRSSGTCKQRGRRSISSSCDPGQPRIDEQSHDGRRAITCAIQSQASRDCLHANSDAVHSSAHMPVQSRQETSSATTSTT